MVVARRLQDSERRCSQQYAAPLIECFGNTTVAELCRRFGPRDHTARWRAAHDQLSAIDADTADKVKAPVAAMGDGVLILDVVKALEGYGRDAAPALPLLRKLRLSPDDAIRNAATDAIKKIE
jgi:hypothetical protein